MSDDGSVDDGLVWSARYSLLTGRVSVLSFHAGIFPQERCLTQIMHALTNCDGMLLKVAVLKAGQVHTIAMGDATLDYPMGGSGDDEA